ncbi:MAG: alpha-glycosidase [Brevinematales bacterium]|nr:alpha-glycosidase [Brevinematales bacterium]
MHKYNVFFKFGAHYDTKRVEVVGDFNNWERGSLLLEDEDGDNVWWGAAKLPAGRYEYKFLVDGTQFVIDPRNPLKSKNNSYENSLLLVGSAKLKEDFIHIPHIDFFIPTCFYIRAAINFEKFSDARLIVVVDDLFHTVNGYELYRDEVYAYLIFHYRNGFGARNVMYYFEIDRIGNGKEYFGRNGLIQNEWEVEHFEYVQPEGDLFKSPDWVKDAVFYQIFPERFYNGNPAINPQDVAPVSQLPKADTFYGGDLDGVIRKLDHIKELGANAIYFNPIFEAQSTHKFDTADYMKIDPHFGDDDTFDRLSAETKKRDIRFILDGVFNHTGTDFAAFKDIEKNGAKSKYKDWYFVKKFPLMENGKPNYTCWWDFPSLPKLNALDPAVEKYLLGVAKHWIHKGASGWRLDVPTEIDHPYWKEFRKAVKTENPDAYIVGEIWFNASPWLDGTEFDAVMNYRFRDASLEFFANRRINADEFVKIIGEQIYDYPMQANFAMLNLLTSHDTARFFTVAGERLDRVRLAIAFQFTYMGAPCVYYGEETGMTGGKDPDNRRFMNWNEQEWNKDLLQLYKKLAGIRHDNEVLRRGELRFFYIKGMTIGFERFIKDQKLLILINNSDENVNIDVTRYAGNGEFLDISKDYPLKRKRAYTLYANDFAILKKIRDLR